MSLTLLEGNEAISWAAHKSGCRFFAGYPITPASTIFDTMLRLLPPQGGICIQGEDEIASIGYCLGASMAGLKVMTATSGPGLSLYSENISFAIGSEIPIVIVDVQRLGPSSGSATRGSDGDIQFLRWGNSGGLPVIVLAPADVKDCYMLTCHAFNLAEEYRCPVFIASNKEVSMTRESIEMESFSEIEVKERQPPPRGEPFLPFGVPSGRMVPYFLPIGDKALVRQISSTHDPAGYITTDPEEIGKCRVRLRAKLVSCVNQFSFYESYIAENTETLLITYGATSRAAKEVYESLKNQDNPVSLLLLKTIWPVPRDIIRECSVKAKRVIVVEMNLGLYVKEIERILPDKNVKSLAQMDGRLITPRQIKEAINGE